MVGNHVTGFYTQGILEFVVPENQIAHELNGLQIDLILPAEACDVILEQLNNTQKSPRYSKVHMTLGDVLQGDFFNEYIKKGMNVSLVYYCVC